MRSGVLLLALVLQLGEEHTADAGHAPRSLAPRAPFLGAAGIVVTAVCFLDTCVICGHRSDLRMCVVRLSKPCACRARALRRSEGEPPVVAA